MRNNLAQLERLEAEEIAREDAIKRIVALVKRHNLRREDFAQIFGDTDESEQPAKNHYLDAASPAARLFDPFFDAW